MNLPPPKKKTVKIRWYNIGCIYDEGVRGCYDWEEWSTLNDSGNPKPKTGLPLSFSFETHEVGDSDKVTGSP